MTTEEMKALNRRFYDEVFNEGNLDLLDELVADDFVEHEEFPGLPPGKEAVRAFATMLRDAFPDARFTIDDEIVEGDKIVTRSHLEGTHRGEFLGMPPTGLKINIQAIDIVRVRDGKAIDHWGVTDQMSMMQQLGVIEQPPG